MTEVSLSYFKRSGKWYADGAFTSKGSDHWDIVDEVREMSRRGELPGLAEGCGSDFTVLVSVSGYEVPHLIFPSPERRVEKARGPAVMLRENGARFRCSCGGNVFTKIPAADEHYSCNGCGTIWAGDPLRSPVPSGARYSIKCGDCGTEFARTESLKESAAGGRCRLCVF